MNKNLKKAFTLVEMLIVVIIIGILMAALFPKITGAQAKARDTARKAAVTNLKPALMSYYDEKGDYPTGKCVSDLSGELADYIQELPKDPQNGRKAYGTQTDGCTGEPAYTSMKNGGADNASYVVITNIETFGKTMNWVLSGNIYFSTGLDVVNQIEKKCLKGVVSSGTTTYCNSSNKQGSVPKTANKNGVYVDFGG